MANNRIVSNLFWAVLGKTVTLGGSLFVGIVIARYLGPEQYGLMNYVVSFVFLFQVFATFGLDNIEIREEAKRPNDRDKLIGTAFTIKIILAIITMIATILTSFLLESNHEVTLLVAIYSFSMIANSFNVARNYFTAIVQNQYIAKSEIFRTSVGIIVKLCLLFLHASLIWFIIALLFDLVMLAVGYITAYTRQIDNVRNWCFDKGIAAFMLKESFPLLLTSAAVIIYQRIDQVMIGNLVNKESVGYFSVAARIVEILIYVPTIAVQTLGPILVEALEQDHNIYQKKAQSMMGATLWTTIAVSAVTSLLSFWVITILFGKEYIPAVVILQILSFKAASVALSNVAGQMLVIEGLQKWAIFRDSMGCVICIVLNYLLLPTYGAVAAAFVAIASNLVAGYLADAIIPPYRHIFKMQSKAILIGWKDLGDVVKLIRK